MKAACVSAILLVALLLVGARGAQAKATMTPFEGIETLVVPPTGGRVWISDGILHIRGQVEETFLAGTCGEDSCSGPVHPVINVDVNLATGDGTVFGSVTIDWTWGDRTGSFVGTFSGKITGGLVMVRFVSTGSGDFGGVTFKGTGTQDPAAGVFVFEGVLLESH